MPTGRAWWDVVGWAAFAVGLVLECVPLLRGAEPSAFGGWLVLALYVFWMLSQFFGERVSKLREQQKARAREGGARGSSYVLLFVVGMVLVVGGGIEYVHKDLGLPFGVVLLAIYVVGWLTRPLVFRLQGSSGGSQDEPADGAGTAPKARSASKRVTWKQVLGLAIAALALLLLYRCATISILEGEEAETALAELEELIDSAQKLGIHLSIQAMQTKKKADADPGRVAALEARSKLAYKVAGGAFVWKQRLKDRRVAEKDREKLKQTIQRLREDLERVKKGGG